MKVFRFFCLAAVVLGLISALPGFAQSITSGDIAGVVTDPSGAVVPNAKVTATNDGTGISHSTNTNGEGFYRFPFLAPGPYTVSANAGGFQPGSVKIQVAVGITANGNLALAVTAASTTIEVTTTPTHVDNADLSTNFSQEQISLVPNPGNDLSAIAQTAPGVVMNTQSGFGNFSSYGLPGTSNLFTIDGQNDNDPFLNLNNSGATNLLLGANDIQEATVTNNGYSGQYGQLAGAQVNYVTKSGTNQWHGNAIYYWNGRVLNGNDYINNLQVGGQPSTPRGFDNVNQWAASVGGPIQKDKTFFFFNYEGLRVIIPTAATLLVPSNGFEASTLASVAVANPAEVPFYQNMFNLYNATPNRAAGTPAPCTSLGVTFTDCGLVVRNLANNFTHEYQTSLRVDHKFSENDSGFIRVQADRGIQATFTDHINPIFNDDSNQPEFQGQIGETHVFNSNVINEFKFSNLWYAAKFVNPNQAQAFADFPTNLFFIGGFSGLGGIDSAFPQGRNVEQYQIVDDISINKGNHTFKLGVNFRRYDVTDYDYGINAMLGTPGNPFGGTAITDLSTFQQGQTLIYNVAFPSALEQPIALYGLGVYGQDEWRVGKKLKVTLALRIDHNSNPVCQNNCFAALTSPFSTLNHDPTIPYNQAINTGLHQAYPATDIVVWQPRFGFAYSPFASNKTVIRGGIGIFGDSFPATVVDNFSKNPPLFNTFNVFFGGLAPASGAASAYSLAFGSNNAFLQGFNSGGTLASISAADPFFTPPAITSSNSRIRQPRYQEWNLQIEQNVGWNTVLSANYVGNHGIFEGILDEGLNAFDTHGFGGLPAAPPDPRFGQVNAIISGAVSNYNGLTASLTHSFNRGLAFGLNYTWSHSLDEVSNGGLLPFSSTTVTSPLNAYNPFNIRANYGNSDYDVRHYFSANYVWDNALRHLFKWGPNMLFGGWTVSGTLFARSGLPFTVVDGNVTGILGSENYGGSFPAEIVGPTSSLSCGKTSATPNATTGVVSPCLNSSGFADPTSLNFNQERNQFRGPKYFDTDFTVQKAIKLRERLQLAFAVQFFNLFNHPNFDLPVNDFAASPQLGQPSFPGNLGTVVRTVNTPTSILGSFLGGDASPRLIQLKASLKF